MKPVGVTHRRLRSQLREGRLAVLDPRARFGQQHPLVVARHDLDERGRERVPRREDLGARARCWCSARGGGSAAESHRHPRRRSGSRSTICGLHRRAKSPPGSNTYATPPLMPAAKLRPVRPSTTTRPRRHVLAAMVADALDHRDGAAVAHREALAGQAAHVGFAAGRAVERDVADDDVVLGGKRRIRRRQDRELAARQTLAPAVVGVAFEPRASRLSAGRRRSSGRPNP